MIGENIIPLTLDKSVIITANSWNWYFFEAFNPKVGSGLIIICIQYDIEFISNDVRFKGQLLWCHRIRIIRQSMKRWSVVSYSSLHNVQYSERRWGMTLLSHALVGRLFHKIFQSSNLWRSWTWKTLQNGARVDCCYVVSRFDRKSPIMVWSQDQ